MKKIIILMLCLFFIVGCLITPKNDDFQKFRSQLKRIEYCDSIVRPYDKQLCIKNLIKTQEIDVRICDDLYYDNYIMECYQKVGNCSGGTIQWNGSCDFTVSECDKYVCYNSLIYQKNISRDLCDTIPYDSVRQQCYLKHP